MGQPVQFREEGQMKLTVSNGGEWLRLVIVMLAVVLLPPRSSAQTVGAVEHLRVLGGLANLNQYVKHEHPFWTQQFPRLTEGLATAEIVPFDKAGLSSADLLQAVRIGAVSVGTVLLSSVDAIEPEVALPDLAGLNPDFDSLRRSMQAYRPRLTQVLKQKYDLELLAVFTYPAQVVYCARPFDKLSDLSGRRVRVASSSQASLISALGGLPIQMPFSQVVPGVRSASVDCAITGTMSGNTVGLHEVTTHLHPMALNWGLSVVVVQAARWKAMHPRVRAVLDRELPVLERQVWAEAQSETEEGLACNVGNARCKSGRKGLMKLVEMKPSDNKARLDALHSRVLPNWLQHCGDACRTHWQAIVASRPELRAN
jgi:TRAP-type C4-dicarboxylate transport system substrate-binding protein